MFEWIRGRKWLPSALLAAILAISTGTADFFLQGWVALIISLFLTSSVVFARNLSWVSVAIFTVGSVAELLFRITPVLAGLSVAVSVAIVAWFGSVKQRRFALGAGIAAGLAVTSSACFSSDFLTSVYGIHLYDEGGRFFAFMFGSALVVTTNVTFFFLGRLTFTQYTHVGTSIDRQVVTAEQSKLNLELAEQNQRFSIARDITDLIIQRISTVLTLAQGGNYASKVDPAAGGRALERLEETAREAHLELRRLYDMLNRSQSVSSAPLGIENLDTLLLEFRQLGYSITLRHVGDQFQLSEGANLAVYRIVFEALENIRENAVIGSDIAVDFMWANDGLQVLIKDNGIEASNRQASAKNPEFVSEYTATDDLKALVEPISGVGITAMRDRAALYGGTVEAHLVPGVGFTLSAMFPMMRTLGGSSRSDK